MKTDKQKDSQPLVSRSEGRIANKYFKDKTVSKIQFGQIFRVINQSTGAHLLCKSVSKRKIFDMDRFNKEAAGVLKIDHPNVEKVYDIFEDDNSIYVVMEECSGPKLFDFLITYIANNNPYNEQLVSSLFKQIISSISQCHAQGISHKEITPDNFVFSSDNLEAPLKLLNVSTSKIFGELKTLGKRTGEQGSKGVNPAAKNYNPIFVPPELLQGIYEEKSDIWCAGVILYMLISGISPFNGTNAEIYKAISRKKASYADISWKGVSDEVKDLLKHMLCDIQSRFTAHQVIEHEWVKSGAQSAHSTLINFNIGSFKYLSSNYQMKKGIISLIGKVLNDEHIAKLKEAFDEFKGEDGTISIKEMKETFLSLGIEEETFKLALESMDIDGDGRIDYNEFLLAGIEQMSFNREEELKQLFIMIDTDHSGKLSKKELKNALRKQKVPDNTIDKFVKEGDLDRDGEIDYNEFLLMIEKISIATIKGSEYLQTGQSENKGDK